MTRRSLAAALVLLAALFAAAPAGAATRVKPVRESAFAPNSIFNSLVPGAVALAGDRIATTAGSVPVNPTVGRELAAFAKRADGSSNSWINYYQYTARITRVSASTALQPVRLCRFGNQCVPSWATSLDRAMRGVARDGSSLGGGVPVPANFVPAKDSDGSAVLYQPDYVAPDGKRGRLWELWQLKRNPAFDPTRPVSPENTRWQASWGGRMVGTQGQGLGYWTDCWWRGCGFQADTTADPDAWGRPDSQATQRAWGSTATSLPLLGTVVSLPECRSGIITHAVGIEVPDARPGAWWPAQRGDGSDSRLALTEGMRLMRPRSVAKPKGVTTRGAAMWRAARRYGLIIDDKTSSSLNFRAEPGCEKTRLWGKVAASEQMRSFPWAKLRVVARGTPGRTFVTR